MRIAPILILALFIATPVGAADPVYFPDERLELAVEAELWVEDPTAAEMLWLTSLRATSQEIRDLTGLEYAVNLYTLQVTHNQIEDLEPLSGLINLRTLIPNNNQISDISPLAGLINLEYLDIHENRIEDIWALSGLVNLQFLNIHDNRISDISPLSGLRNLEFLDLQGNEIEDLSALSNLTSLRQLALQGNQIRDVSPLSGLVSLETLDLSGNEIPDLSSLMGLAKLTRLFLRRNPLNADAYCHDLQNLTENNPDLQIYYDANPVPPANVAASDGDHAYVEVTWDVVCNGPGYTSHYRVYRAASEQGTKSPVSDWQTSLRFADSNVPPGTAFYYWVQAATSVKGFHAGAYSAPDTGWRKPGLTVSSTPGGSVTVPGVGTFAYALGDIAVVDTEPTDPNLFFFLAWMGTAVDAGKVADPGSASTTVLMDGDCTLKAHFATRMSTIHVDANAPDDPGPGDPAVSDPNENGTPQHPFDTIQEAIDVAVDGISVLVRPAIYRERIDLKGCNIRIEGYDPNDPNGPRAVIDGGGAGPVVTFVNGEGPDCLLDGFVITGGAGDPAGAVFCQGTRPTISHCLVVGNRSLSPDGAAVYCADSNAVLANCTIADNIGLESCAGIYLEDSNVILTNTIVWNNTPHEVFLAGSSEPSIRYSDIAGGWPGVGNITEAPLFAQPGRFDPNGTPEDPQDDVWFAGDYHLKSQAGRWSPVSNSWIEDDVISPCIDAGDPFDPVTYEPYPNGSRINMGAHGGTAQASKSP